MNNGLIYDARPKSSTAGSWIKPVNSGLIYDARPKSSTAGSWIKPGSQKGRISFESVFPVIPVNQAPSASSSAPINTPLIESPALGSSPLDVKQRNAVIGEPIPIVFCRRTGGAGGVLISPPATEARFEDDASSNITASYHLVLSEGQIDSIQVRDVFQRSCRVGSFTQTYGRRAGTFVAGNFINNTPNLEAPIYCGTSGTYDGLSTMAFSVTIPAGFDQWNRQVHCFIRGGVYVVRLLDSVTGPSNNVADLLLYLLRNSSRVPEAMIDTATSFLAAATFTNANGFWFNGVVSKSTNLRDWIGSTLQYFLLRQARIGGKEALKPLVPTNSNGTIKTTAVSWAFTFTEQHIIPDSFEITYTPLADRKPFCAVMLWRQQDDLGIPVMRNTEVRYTGTAVDGPYEQHDLSEFCSTENHAVKIGTYIISKRKHVTHRLRIGVKPDAYNPTLGAGDLVRVRLERIASTGADSVHDYLYEVDRIGKSIGGEVQLDLTHFPVDANRASVVALEVAAAVGSGLLLPTGLSGITCDTNSSSNTSVPAETFTEATFPDYEIEISEIEEEELGDDQENPKDELAPDVSINWETTQSGLIDGPGGWEFEPGGLTIRFNIQDSPYCGGSNDNLQTGQATATITTTRRLFLSLELTGMVHSLFDSRDKLFIYLNGEEIRRATGGSNEALGGGCAMAPPLQVETVPPPYILAPGATNTLLIDYAPTTTSSQNSSFYQCKLRFFTEPTGRPA